MKQNVEETKKILQKIYIMPAFKNVSLYQTAQIYNNLMQKLHLDNIWLTLH